MMIFFNKVGNSWVAKGIFIALALSMVAFWGIGGLTNTTQYSDEAISVGNKTVSANQLMQSFEQERQKLNGLAGGYISPKKAVELGLVEQVVQQHVNQLINEGVKSELGLAASNDAVQKYVEKNPAFSDALGNFDRNLFYAYLRQMRMTEAELAEKLQNELALKHLGYAVSGLAYAPNKLTNLLYKYQNEKRDITTLLIDTDQLTVTSKPSNDELKEYYEAYSDQFMLPEYRSFSVVRLTPEMMIDRVKVSQEELDAAYQEQKEKYVIPEKREVSQIRFETEEAAQSQLKNLTPDNFEKIAMESVKQTQDQTNFGYITRDELLDDLVEPVFTADKNKIIGPVKSVMGWHLLVVKNIKAASSMSEQEIRSKIKLALSQDKTYEEMYETMKKVEDILGAGDSLKRVSEQLKLPLMQVSNVDMTGKMMDGTTLNVDFSNQNLLKSIFILHKGDTTPLIENGTGYLVAQLTDVKPVSQKEFKDVQDDLTSLWTGEKKKELLESKTKDILEKVKQGKAALAEGTFSNFKVDILKNIERTEKNILPINVVEHVFEQKAGPENVASFPVPKGNLLVIVNAIHHPEMHETTKDYVQIQKSLQDSITTELVENIISSYAHDFGVNINKKEITKIFSVYSSDME